MGIYDRDYYRDSSSNRDAWGWGFYGMPPVVKWLILINVAVFLLQIIALRDDRRSPLEEMRKHNPKVDEYLTQLEEGNPEGLEALKKDNPELYRLIDKHSIYNLTQHTPKVSIIQEWCQLDTQKVVYQGQVWRLLTHAFCHDRYGLFHILFNMLLLYWFGSTLESMYGSREFLLFYLTAAVVAALAFVGMDLYTGATAPAIGASGAVMAVMMLYTMHFPRATICVCWFFPIEMRWLMLFYLIWDLHPVLLALAGEQMFTGIANAAHLGGLAFGFCYAKYQWRLEPLADRLSWPHWSWERKPRLRLVSNTLSDLELKPETDQVEQLLQKILESGQASLTDEERAVLRNASERMKNRSRGKG